MRVPKILRCSDIMLLAKEIKEHPEIFKALQLMVEIAEATRREKLALINRHGILVNSDLFVFEEEIHFIDKWILNTLERFGIIRRNKMSPRIIEIVDIDKVIDAVNLLKYRNILEATVKQEVKRISKLETARKKLNLLEELLPYVAPHVEDVQGIEYTKKAILLQIFAAKDITDDEGKTIQRNRIHILLVGAPGTGKTLLLKWTASVVNGKYQDCTRLTGAGLAGSLRKNVFESVGSILQRYNGKIIALDEVDKIKNEDLDPLLQAMEDGIVTLAGAEMETEYEARIRVIAASNRTRFRPEFLDRFDYIKIFRNPTKREISKVTKKIVDILTEYGTSEESTTVSASKAIIRSLLKKVRKFQPKIIDSEGVQYELDMILAKTPYYEDSVRQHQRWLRFAFAFARLHKTHVNGEVVRKVFEELNEKGKYTVLK